MFAYLLEQQSMALTTMAFYGALERKTDHLADSGDKPRQVLWRIYSKRAMICGGATERSIAFPNNDRPGIMLAGSVRGVCNEIWCSGGY